MKYFKYFYWESLNSTNKFLRTYADYKWKRAVCNYTQHFLKLQHHLPSNFVNTLDITSNFHDAKLSCIYHEVTKNNVILIICSDSYKVRMTTFNSKPSWKHSPVGQTLFIGYCEVEKWNNLTVWRILFDNGNELTLKFSRINIVVDS